MIVIGGGINGASIAFNLAKQGVRVTLVEKTFIAGGPTGRSSAVVRQHYSNIVTARMVLRSLRVFQNFDDIIGGNCDFRQTGYLLGAREEDMETLEANVTMQKSVGIGTSIISPEEIKELEPQLSTEGIVAAAYEPESGYADPASTASAYAGRAKELGAELRLNTRALSIGIEKEKVIGLQTDRGSIPAGAVVVAAGPWSPGLIKPTGIDLPIRSTRHEVCVYQYPTDFQSDAVYADFVEEIYTRPETGNLMLVGSIADSTDKNDVSDPDRFDEGVSFETIAGYAERVIHRYPGMVKGSYTTGYASLYDVTPDWHPILDELPNVRGLYGAAGGSGHGFKLAPAVGEMMADLVLNGKKDGDDIDLFSSRRFEKGNVIKGRYAHSIVG
ncbi:NAD(P)/FAD-dependent oxidoreductase [Thermodesulfobacteriota bacterium]